jgi:hypothetical protein
MAARSRLDLQDMSAATTVPRSTTLSTLRSRHDDVARSVRTCEANVERLRSELRVPPPRPGATPPAERKMISAVRGQGRTQFASRTPNGALSMRRPPTPALRERSRGTPPHEPARGTP